MTFEDRKLALANEFLLAYAYLMKRKMHDGFSFFFNILCFFKLFVKTDCYSSERRDKGMPFLKRRKSGKDADVVS